MDNQEENKNNPDFEPTDPGNAIPKQDWPIGPLQDVPLDEKEPIKQPDETSKSETRKKGKQGPEQWPSVSWP